MDADRDGNGNAWQLPPNLQDFADLKDAMTLVTGLDMMDGEFKGHGWGVVYVLAGGDGTICNIIGGHRQVAIRRTARNAQGTQWQPTIDQLVAKAIHTNEPYKSLETGILKYTGVNMGTASLNLAHIGANMPLPPERDPAKLFNTLFGSGHADGRGRRRYEISNKLRRSVLDAVLADAKRLQMSLGSADAKRIDAHMESVRALEMRIPTMAGGANLAGRSGAATTPATPTAQAANLDLAKVTATSQAMNQTDCGGACPAT